MKPWYQKSLGRSAGEEKAEALTQARVEVVAGAAGVAAGVLVALLLLAIYREWHPAYSEARGFWGRVFLPLVVAGVVAFTTTGLVAAAMKRRDVRRGGTSGSEKW